VSTRDTSFPIAVKNYNGKNWKSCTTHGLCSAIVNNSITQYSKGFVFRSTRCALKLADIFVKRLHNLTTSNLLDARPFSSADRIHDEWENHGRE